MKNYSERFGQSLRVRFDPVTKTFVEVSLGSIQFLPSKSNVPSQQKLNEREGPELRYAAE